MCYVPWSFQNLKRAIAQNILGSWAGIVISLYYSPINFSSTMVVVLSGITLLANHHRIEKHWLGINYIVALIGNILNLSFIYVPPCFVSAHVSFNIA